MSLMASRSEMARVIAQPSFTRIQNTVSIGTQAAHGAFWNILFSVLNKLVAFGGQIALAWFLLPDDMGLAGIALAVTSIVSIASGAIPTILLIQHEGAFEENAGEIFWLSLAMNFTATLFLVAVSPLAGHLFKDPRVVPVILILAVAVPLMALPTIYASQLYRDLRFRALAQIKFGEGVIRNAGSVILAALGFGAYALVLPQPAGSLYTAIRCRLLTGKIPIGRPHPHRWPALLAPALWLMALALVNALQMNGTIFVIGVMHNPTVTGFYTWGFMLSSQAIYLLGINLQGVFFPVLSKLNHDSNRQKEAFKRACKILILAIAPLCALQIVLARPVIELLFQDRWLPAAPVVQWLSVGMMTQPLSILGTSLLLARGQYRLLALLAAVIMILITAAAIVGAY
jgi:PST family polysaccharide transporter